MEEIRLKPLKPCRANGCPNLTRNYFCEEHKHIEQEQSSRYNRYQRPTDFKAYRGEWQRIRKMKLLANPLCERCKQQGRFVAAVLVHHRTPVSEGGTNEFNNLESLCQSCHSAEHMSEVNKRNG